MKTGTALLKQLERCGWAAHLAQEHREISDSEFREKKIEIARAFHANDQAQFGEAHAALRWLMSEPGVVRTVGESLDLVDPDTGEVLVQGKPGAVIDTPDGVLVVSWAAKEWHTDEEPDDDLGLLAMGLAASGGKPFRVATVALTEEEAFCRRSMQPYEPAGHAALLDRIRKAVARPKIPCPGEWCGACKQAPHCEAWLARAKTALAVLEAEAPLEEGDDGKPRIPQLDLTNDSAGQVMARIKLARKACDLAEEQVKAFERRGGHVVVNGKEYYSRSCDGKETVSAAAVKDLAKKNDADSPEVVALKAQLAGLVKTGDPFESFGWRNAKAAVKVGGKR